MKSSRNRQKKIRPPATNPLEDEQRLFVAVPVPPTIKVLVGSLVERLATLGPEVRWVDPDTVHLTIHFLGATPPEQTELVKMQLAQATKNLTSFELRTTELGAFPNIRKPSVLWLGLADDSDSFREVHKAVGEKLAELDFHLDSKPPVPHLTLGRVRNTANHQQARSIDTTFRQPALQRYVRESAVEFEVDRIELIQSHLEKTGPRYEIRGMYPLG